MRALALGLALLASAATPVRGDAPPAPGAPDGGCPPNDESCAPASPIAAPTLVVPTGTPAQLEAWLRERISAVLEAPALRSARLGVSVIDVDSGRAIFARNDKELLNPASNVKLFTTAAALSLLGPEFRWKTTVYVDGSVSSGEIKGRVYLQGRGDPTLVIEDLWKIATDLWARGVRKIQGDLVVDDTYFDEVRLGPGFDQKQEDQPFRAPNGAVSLNYNAVAIHILPGAADAAPGRVLLDPETPYFVIHNEVRTVAKGRTSLAIELREQEAAMDITVRGRISKSDGGRTELRRIAHPDLYTAYAFRELLARRGIKLTGTIVRGAVPTQARALVQHVSSPLSVVVREINKRSSNFMAEQLVKTLGAEVGGKPGSWPKGLAAIADFLDKLGIGRADYKMQNGSGLYDTNRFTTAQATQLLRSVSRDFRVAADFVGSLAVAGADGTISHRLSGTVAERQVRAKTGTLQGTSSLAGYAGWPNRSPLAFAIFVNGLSDGATSQARAAQDEICRLLVTYLSAIK